MSGLTWLPPLGAASVAAQCMLGRPSPTRCVPGTQPFSISCCYTSGLQRCSGWYMRSKRGQGNRVG